MLRKALLFLMMAVVGCVEVDEDAFSNVKHEDGKIYIVDLRAHKWDITQAVTLGFKPKKIQYGIGRNAFTHLDDSLLTGERFSLCFMINFFLSASPSDIPHPL